MPGQLVLLPPRKVCAGRPESFHYCCLWGSRNTDSANFTNTNATQIRKHPVGWVPGTRFAPCHASLPGWPAYWNPQGVSNDLLSTRLWILPSSPLLVLMPWPGVSFSFDISPSAHSSAMTSRRSCMCLHPRAVCELCHNGPGRRGHSEGF